MMGFSRTSRCETGRQRRCHWERRPGQSGQRVRAAAGKFNRPAFEQDHMRARWCSRKRTDRANIDDEFGDLARSAMAGARGHHRGHVVGRGWGPGKIVRGKIVGEDLKGNIGQKGSKGALAPNHAEHVAEGGTGAHGRMFRMSLTKTLRPLSTPSSRTIRFFSRTPRPSRRGRRSRKGGTTGQGACRRRDRGTRSGGPCPRGTGCSRRKSRRLLRPSGPP